MTRTTTAIACNLGIHESIAFLGALGSSSVLEWSNGQSMMCRRYSEDTYNPMASNASQTSTASRLGKFNRYAWISTFRLLMTVCLLVLVKASTFMHSHIQLFDDNWQSPRRDLYIQVGKSDHLNSGVGGINIKFNFKDIAFTADRTQNLPSLRMNFRYLGASRLSGLVASAT